MQICKQLEITELIRIKLIKTPTTKEPEHVECDSGEGRRHSRERALQAAAGFLPRVHSTGIGQELRGEVYSRPALLRVSRRGRCPSVQLVHSVWAEAGGGGSGVSCLGMSGR